MVPGTDALEGTTYFLNLTVVYDELPIVVTGAKRPLAALSTDGPINLLDAIRVAVAAETAAAPRACWSSPTARSTRRATLPRRVHLGFILTLAADLGVLGYVDADSVLFYRAPLRRHTADSEFDLGGVAAMPQVDIIYIHAGARSRL